MPNSYEQHLQEARKAQTQSQMAGLTRAPKKHGAATDPQHPWRDDPSWREGNGWKEESARHMRGD